MARLDLMDRLKQGVFILDGGMGSQLVARSVKVSCCNDYLSIDDPETIQAIHQDYFDAGSDAVITNSFGANRVSLAKYDLEDQCQLINEAAARNARAVAGDDRYVIGDIGPCGEFVEPLGTLKPESLQAAFVAGVQGLVAGGVDAIIVETMTDLQESLLAVKAIKSVDSRLPVFASMAFDCGPAGARTMMGVDPVEAVTTLAAAEVNAVGFNCGSATLDQYVELATSFVDAVQATNKNIFVYAEPNAGKPDVVGGQAVYSVEGPEFAAAIEQMHKIGITIFGGCCGTGPEHIKALADAFKRD